MKTIRDIAELTPTAQKACGLFLQRCKEMGLSVYITETYRPQERQDELYAQGRTKPGKVVTWTKNSRHKSRRAWDICKLTGGKADYSDAAFFKACGNVAKELDITWGGNWKTPDMPHFEIAETWTEPKEDTMTAEERGKFNALVEQVEKLTARVDKLAAQNRVYHYTSELPDWARPTVQKLLDSGTYTGAAPDDLNLPETLMRALVIGERRHE